MSETLPIWRDGAFHADEWARFAPDAALPASGEPQLVPLAVFIAEPQKFLGYNGRVGIEVSSGESVRPLEPHLSRLSLVAVNFPKFHDGRGYSAVRLLRERYKFQGEIRATGDVLADQIPLMRRCGVTTYEVRNAPTRAALEAGRLAEVRHYYQPIPTEAAVPAGTRPWLRQPAV